MFPSPCGDYGSYRYVLANDEIGQNIVSVPLRGLWFLSQRDKLIKRRSALFPSPCGDYGSYLESQLWNEDFKPNVSVPLRGLWFLSTTFGL